MYVHRMRRPNCCQSRMSLPLDGIPQHVDASSRAPQLLNSVAAALGNVLPVELRYSPLSTEKKEEGPSVHLHARHY